MTRRANYCKNDEHPGWRGPPMTRLYVRRTEDGKRKWEGIGWVCEGTYYNRGCGSIELDEKPDTETRDRVASRPDPGPRLATG